jgi:SAM-dependent methyltransferase
MSAAREIASRFDSRFLRSYVRIKISTDPVFAAASEIFRDTGEPILDLGCGVGLLALYLRARGISLPVTGIDFDPRKIEIARRVATTAGDRLDFLSLDAREAPSFHGSVAMIDLLHYFSAADQRRLLDRAAESVVDGGVAIVRDCVRDASWRFRLTKIEEWLATTSGWLKPKRLEFPTAASIIAPFRERGFEHRIEPSWGRTPFNNYLFIFSRPHTRLASSGMTDV